MKKLFLIRHGKSSWVDPLLTDFERPLNERGRANSHSMAKVLNDHDFHPELIYSSPANRAISTARIIAEGIHYPLKKIKVVEEMYDAEPATVLSVIKDTDDSINTLMLFGHNPSFIMLAQQLLQQEIEFFPTCAICGIEFQIKSWQEIDSTPGKCFIFQSPKKNLLG